jgi:hypothetical protein
MSVVYKGKVIDTNLSREARGGTEMMRERLIKNVPQDLLKDFAIHFSRPREIYSDVKNARIALCALCYSAKIFFHSVIIYTMIFCKLSSCHIRS